MTALRALICNVVIFLLGLGSCAIEETLQRSTTHGPGHVFVRVKNDMRSFESALNLFHLENDSYPSSLTELESTGSMRGYLKKVSRDPWGGDYVYRRVSDGYLIYSPGRDGKDDSGGGDDVVKEDKEYTCESYGVGRPKTPIELAKLVSLIVVVASFVGIFGLSMMLFFRWIARMYSRVRNRQVD